jgi:hypothetical protein
VPDSSPCTTSRRAPILAEAEATHRVSLLAAMQTALTAQGVDSVLVRNRRLVLRSGSGRLDPSGPTEPELHIFAPEGKNIATTDGAEYHFASGKMHPADDPHGAATLAGSAE